MTSVNPAGQTGYGPAIAGDGAQLVESEEGISVVIPQLTPATGELSPAAIDPRQNWLTTGGAPVLNAILVELRVISELLVQERGASALDLNQMRASELNDSLTSTGVV